MEALPVRELEIPREVSFERYGGGQARIESLTDDHISETDAARIVDICNQPKVQKWVTSRYATGPNSRYTDEDARTFIRMARNDWLKQTGFPYIIRDENDRLVGTIGIRSADKKEPEIGYWADTTPNSGGYVTNALLKLCEIADKADYASLCAHAMPDNLSSRGVLERAGFTDMGVMPYQRAGDNLVVDAVKYVRSLSRT